MYFILLYPKSRLESVTPHYSSVHHPTLHLQNQISCSSIHHRVIIVLEIRFD